MARLIPNVEIDRIYPISEQKVARALVEQLPQDCVIYHSYPWLHSNTHSGNPPQKTLYEGEIDFVILWPEHGLLVLEVKGGKIDYREEERDWYSTNQQGETNRIKDPFDQARKNMYAIKKLLEKKQYSSQNIPFTYGYAVCFSGSRYRGGVPPGSEPSIILDMNHLPKIKSSLQSIFNYWNHASSQRSITPADRKKVDQILLPEFNLIPVLSSQIEDQEADLVRMSEDQLHILEMVKSNSRMAIEGVAGSGKTLLALEKARRLAADGKKTALLCFNKALAGSMKNSINQSEYPLIEVYHFHGLVEEFCNRAGVTFNLPASDDSDARKFWVETSLELFMEALDVLPDRYDAVIVDEAQDFREDWWIAIDEVNNGGGDGILYLFYDPNQILFDLSSTLPNMQILHLPVNYRNTRQISELCSQILGLVSGEEIKVLRDTPAGEECEHRVIKESGKRFRQLESWVQEWVKKDNIQPRQIAILSPYRQDNTIMANLLVIARVPLVSSVDEWNRNEGILVATIRSFKGLEADIVVLIDAPPVNEKPVFQTSDYYVAVSRAKHLLKVLVPKKLL